MLEITSGGRAGAGQDQELTEFLDFEDGSNVQGGAQQQQQQSGAGTVGQESTEEPRRPQEPEIERASQVDTAAATAAEDKQIKHLPDFIDRLQTCVSVKVLTAVGLLLVQVLLVLNFNEAGPQPVAKI